MYGVVAKRWYLPMAVSVVMSALIAGCDKTPSPGAVNTPSAQAGAAQVADVDLTDIIEQKPTYLIGITFPKDVSIPPPLKSEIKAFADASRDRLIIAARDVKPGSPGAPYDLSLEFRELPGNSPAVRTFSADGSMYTGGEHGNALIRRFVWDVRGERLITANDLVSTPEGWQALSKFVKEALLKQAGERFEEDKLSDAEKAALLAQLKPLVEEGTQPSAENYQDFEPMLDSNGKMIGITFIFPPYQVAGYADGVQRVDVPASVFAPYLSANVRNHFDVPPIAPSTTP